MIEVYSEGWKFIIKPDVSSWNMLVSLGRKTLALDFLSEPTLLSVAKPL